MAKTLGGAWGRSHEVVLGSRDPAREHPGFPVQPLTAAVREADVVVNAIRVAR